MGNRNSFGITGRMQFTGRDRRKLNAMRRYLMGLKVMKIQLVKLVNLKKVTQVQLQRVKNVCPQFFCLDERNERSQTFVKKYTKEKEIIG